MGAWREFQGVNAGYVLELYERFCQDPNSVDAATRVQFEHWPPLEEESTAPPSGQRTADSGRSESFNFQFPISNFQLAGQVGVCYPASGVAVAIDKLVGAVNLAESIRKFGH